MYRWYSDGVVLGMSRYSNATKEDLDRDYNIEARIEPGDVVQNPGDVDEAKWEAAKKAAAESGHSGNYAVVTTIYKKAGGTFRRKS